MFAYRLTKYDPAKREANGAFGPEDWTSVSDIGRTFGGQLLSLSKYIEAENAYVESAGILLAASDVTWMRVTDLEERAPEHQVGVDDAVLESCRQIKDGQKVCGAQLDNVIRGCLREYMWCRLAGPNDSYLHFGYDYYMYVGVKKSADELTLPDGMFLEECESPYDER